MAAGKLPDHSGIVGKRVPWVPAKLSRTRPGRSVPDAKPPFPGPAIAAQEPHPADRPGPPRPLWKWPRPTIHSPW
jgi:hypothetical protein